MVCGERYASLKAHALIFLGLFTSKIFHRFGAWKAKVFGTRVVDSDLNPGEKRKAFKVQYAMDQSTLEFEEEANRPLLVTAILPERKKIMDNFEPAVEPMKLLF